MSVFDRRQLRRSFGRAASKYTEVAALQREVEARLLEQLAYLDDRQPQRILDLGSGPGRAAGAMKNAGPRPRWSRWTPPCRCCTRCRNTRASGARCGA